MNVLRYTVGLSGVSKRSFDVRAFGFEEREVCLTCVLRFIVGMSGVLDRSFDVCACVTKEVRALVGND